MQNTNHSKIHPVIREHLKTQGYETETQIAQFLNPLLKELPSPFLMKGMKEAVDLAIEAIDKEYDIIIWGDYDVDGITGTALLILFFKKLNLNVQYHIPNRLSEGYGLNEQKIEDLSKTSTNKKLLITVDCGISNVSEVKRAKELGFRVVVTDHHNPPETEVAADATLNPKQKSCSFPFKELAGVGVAFYLAAGIRAELRNINHALADTCTFNLKSFMAFVSLGTIADVVPLSGVNRILVKGGVESLATSRMPGISELLDHLGVSCKSLNSEIVSFQVAPIINAAGRLGEPTTALHALINSGDNALYYAKKLSKLNNRRKTIGKNDFEKALSLYESSHRKDKKAIVLHGSFHDGLLGIIASRLVESYRLPAFVCTTDTGKDGVYKGSARAPEGFDLFSVISFCSRFLLKYGGHKAAAGFSVKEEYFVDFKRNIEEYSNLEFLNSSHDSSVLRKNYANLSISDAFDELLLENLCQLEPVGEGNSKPVFIDPNVDFISLKHFGSNGEHIRGLVRGKYQNIPFIGFGVGGTIPRDKDSRPYSVRYSHMLDTYNGANRWKIRIESIT